MPSLCEKYAATQVLRIASPSSLFSRCTSSSKRLHLEWTVNSPLVEPELHPVEAWMQLIRSNSACAFGVAPSFVIPSDVSQVVGSEGECSRWMSCDGDGRRVVVNCQVESLAAAHRSTCGIFCAEVARPAATSLNATGRDRQRLVINDIRVVPVNGQTIAIWTGARCPQYRTQAVCHLNHAETRAISFPRGSRLPWAIFIVLVRRDRRRQALSPAESTSAHARTRCTELQLR